MNEKIDKPNYCGPYQYDISSIMAMLKNSLALWGEDIEERKEKKEKKRKKGFIDNDDYGR